MQPKLTIGMACYDDFNGVYFTLQSLRLHHDLDDCELVVVDNSPDSKHGTDVRNLVQSWIAPRMPARYIPMPEVGGTTQPRNRVFAEAAGEAVLCIDCHVLFPLGTIGRLKQWYADNPDCKDLLSGPMLYDGLDDCVTHFDDVWRAEMWGVWGKDERGTNPDNPPFEIPGMGLGLFTCRKDAWLGFNKDFRGFGGEELYIHTKYRQAGHKAMCLPWLRWLHRFGRPGGAPYPLTRYNKVRNYVLGHNELGLPLARVHEHFVDSKLMSQAEWDWLVEDPVAHAAPKPGCGTCGGGSVAAETTLEDLYEKAAKTPSDINEHTAKLRELASQCEVVVEFGHRRGVSTTALLAGQPKQLTSYDLNEDGFWKELKKRQGKTEFAFVKADVTKIEIPECDLLFEDSRHTAAHITAILEKHASKVRRWIAFHDSKIFGERGEDGGPGILPALRKFMREHPEWSVIYHAENNHGFTVISRSPGDKPKLPGKWTMAANFTKAMTAYAMDGFGKSSPALFESRLERCSWCELRNTDRCTVCGCYIEPKAQIAASECPLGRWPVAEPESESEAVVDKAA